MKKVNYIYLFVLPMALLSSSAQAITISFSSGSSNVFIGESVAVDLNVSGLGQGQAPSLAAYDLDVTFDPSRFSVSGNLSLGDQLQLSGVSSIADIAVSPGNINISEISLNDAGLLDANQLADFTLARFNLTGVSQGQGTLGVTVNRFGDIAGQTLPTDTAIVTISVDERATPTPPPPQSAESAATPPNITPLQANTFRSVASICNAFRTNQPAANNAQRDLGERSCELVDTNNDLQGQGSTDNSLGLNVQGLGASLQNVATEETFAPATMATQTTINQFQSIQNQLDGIRQGRSGSNLANFGALKNSKSMNLALLGLALGSLGGAAGDDDEGSKISEKISAFINANASFGDTDRSTREDAFDFNSEGTTLGMDYRFTEQLVSGLAFGYTHQNVNFQKSINVSGGDVDSDGYTGSLYTTFYRGDFYVDGVASFTHGDYDIRRRVRILSNTSAQGANRAARADTEGEQYAASIRSGYEFHNAGLNYGPYLRVSYLYLDIDGYQEKGATGLNLAVEKQRIKSLEAVLGAQASYAFSQSFGVIVPQASLEWHHEFKEDRRQIRARFVNDPAQNVLVAHNGSPDRDFGNFSLGVSGVFQNSLQAFLNYRTIIGLSRVDSHEFNAGIRWSF